MKKMLMLNSRFEDFFAGPRPVFEVSQIKRKNKPKRSLEPSPYIEFEQPPEPVPPKIPKPNKLQKG